MAGARRPGPQCSHNDPVNIDDGTMCLAKSPMPGPVGTNPFLSTWNNPNDTVLKIGLICSGILPEPVAPHSHAGQTYPTLPLGRAAPIHSRPPAIDALIGAIQQEFPLAAIRITGRVRTVQRQAELMAQRRRQSRDQFLGTYRPAAHISEMDNWATANPHASEPETVAAFVEIIHRARSHGAVVSNHLSDHARDISIPVGNPQYRHEVRQRLEQLGAHVLDEHDATTGAHWHVDY